jgi:phosphatidylglycerophosphatase A
MSMAEMARGSWSDRVAVHFATVFGIGWMRPGPGTWASCAAGLMSLLLIGTVPTVGLTATFIGLVILVTLLSLWLLPHAVPHFGVGDPSQVVIDEVAGVWLAVALIPAATLQADPIWSVILAVLLFRVFDIAKPWPVNWFERLPGALGIMADDLVAGAIAGCLAAALMH